MIAQIKCNRSWENLLRIKTETNETKLIMQPSETGINPSYLNIVLWLYIFSGIYCKNNTNWKASLKHYLRGLSVVMLIMQFWNSFMPLVGENQWAWILILLGSKTFRFWPEQLGGWLCCFLEWGGTCLRTTVKSFIWYLRIIIPDIYWVLTTCQASFYLILRSSIRYILLLIASIFWERRPK